MFGLALYSLWNTISLHKNYKNGDYEAGQELIEDLLWNIRLTLATFGLSSLLKYFAKKLALKKLTEIFGENVAKNITKNAEAYDVYRAIKKIRKLGVSDDVIKEFAERMGKDSLDWLENVKKIFNFTDDELRKLVKLGDDLYNYSDEFLEAFKNSNYQDEIIEAVSKYKDDAVDAITNYGDDAAKAISKYDKTAIDLINNNGKDAVKIMNDAPDYYGDLIKKYGVNGNYHYRNLSEYEALAMDPAHNFQIDAKSMIERQIGLELEVRGDITGPIVRDPNPAGAEFIDAFGTKWDIKGWYSQYAPKGYSLEKAMDDIRESISKGENVIVDSSKMFQEHIDEVRKAVEMAGLSHKVVWWP